MLLKTHTNKCQFQGFNIPNIFVLGTKFHLFLFVPRFVGGIETNSKILKHIMLGLLISHFIFFGSNNTILMCESVNVVAYAQRNSHKM